MTQPSDYFERAKALQAMILEAQEDLKQLRADAVEELIPEGTAKNAAKETRADLAEVFALAKIAAKGDMEEKKQAEKLARRKRIAEECGVQLDLLPADPIKAMRASIAKGEVAIESGGERLQADGRGGVESVSAKEPHPHKAGPVVDELGRSIGRLDDNGKFQPLEEEAGAVEEDDTEDARVAHHGPGPTEATALHASPDPFAIPDFLRRT